MEVKFLYNQVVVVVANSSHPWSSGSVGSPRNLAHAVGSVQREVVFRTVGFAWHLNKCTFVCLDLLQFGQIFENSSGLILDL